MPTFDVQIGNLVTGLVSVPATPAVSAILTQTKVDIVNPRQVVIEPNNVGTSSGGGGEIAVVF